MCSFSSLMIQVSEKLMVSTGWQPPSSSKATSGRPKLIQHSKLNWKLILLCLTSAELSLCSKTGCSLFCSALKLGIILAFSKVFKERICTSVCMKIAKPKICTVGLFQKKSLRTPAFNNIPEHVVFSLKFWVVASGLT